MKISALYEGSYSVAADKKFLPFDIENDDPKDRPGSIFIHVSPFLVETQRDLLLLDTGLGFLDSSGTPLLFAKIREAGYEPEDVTKVLMSHLHYDHAGGMMRELNDKWELNFPHADYFVQQGELELALSKPGKSYNLEMLEQLKRSGALTMLNDSGHIDNTIAFERTDAHCLYHQVFTIREGTDIVFFGGDVLPEPIQLVRNYIAKYDLDGRKCMDLRKHYGLLAVEEDRTCLFFHAREKSISKVRLQDGAFLLV